jgi:phage virion morphogenesis protein
MGVVTHIEQDDRRLHAVIRQYIALGGNPKPLMEDLAVIGENTTRERFSTQLDPNGARWKPSLRAQIRGGKTLTQYGRLGDSITHRSDSKKAEWGTNVIYAAIHQIGGAIRAKNGGKLRFRLANGGFANVGEVMMPQRAFLGISANDETDMLDAIQTRINGIANHAG